MATQEYEELSTPNIEFYSTRPSRSWRVRFRIGKTNRDMGYYESYDQALVARNLFAEMFGRDTVNDERYTALFELQAYQDFVTELQSSELWSKAEEIAEEIESRAPASRLNTRDLTAKVTDLEKRVDDLEKGLRALLRRGQ